jgi:hypothetical protein
MGTDQERLSQGMALPMAPITRHTTRDGQRGSILMVSLLALVALLGLGVVTMLAVRSDSAASGHGRFHQMALYAAESGVHAAMDFMKVTCANGGELSDFMEPSNVNPQSPAGIFGNHIVHGQPGNPFSSGNVWYEVTLLNNATDPGYVAGDDEDGQVVVRAVGHGPNNVTTMVEAEVLALSCLVMFCEKEYAQQGMDSRNGMSAVCSKAIDLSGGVRTLGGP